MADCEHAARTTAYFDGALPPGEEAAAAEHVAACAICQRVLGDAVALDAVLSSAKPATVIPIRRRWPLVIAVAGGLAVAAAATIIVWPRAKPATMTIALASERAIEARFTGERFATHRPLGVLRGDRRVEAISLGDLAKLESSKSHRDLVAALAATGDLERARTVIAALPADAASESDRAAVALAVRDHEGALAHAYRALAQAPALPAAWWNLALAARELGLLRSSKAAFEKVAAAAEPGWGDEARAQIAALDKELAAELAFPAFDKRGRAMVDGGPLIDVADVPRYPAFARVYTLDAIRTASGPRLDALRPLAQALDAASGTPTITAAIERAAAVDQAVRAKAATGYRAIVARTLTGPDLDKFLDELRVLGPAVDDIRASAIITSSQGRQRNAEVRALVAPWRDPWFDYAVERERIRASFPDDDLRAEPALLAALATCTNDAWALRCGQLALELAGMLKNTGRIDEAEKWAAKALAWYRVAVAPVHVATARAQLGEIHRNLGRTALARLELEDIGLVEGAGCPLRRYATIALGSLASKELDWPRVRALLDTPVAPAGCASPHEIQGVATASDLAGHTKDPADRTRALAWIDAIAASADPDREQIALVAQVRIGDAAARAALRTGAAAMPATNVTKQAIRTWAFTTLLSEAGGRGAWDEVVAIAREEQRAMAEAPCTLVASVDDGTLTVAAKTTVGTRGEQRAVAQDALATEVLVGPALVSVLAPCPSIAVVARPPLHGRADILPPELPWWFAGDAPAHARGTPARSLEVANPRSPDLALPPLGAVAPSSATFDVSLTGAAATPSRVLAALADATYAELHVHGVASAATAFLALSPDADGTFALGADALRAAKLAKAPIVVLAACRAATVAPMFRARWSLPDAFLGAGAHAVVAVDIPIPDASARRVFDELHRRVDGGEAIETAVAAIRRSARDDLAWASHLMVFR